MYFPNTCLDNFFNNPNLVVRIAEQVEYFKSDGTFPGYRSKEIHIVNPKLFSLICSKIFSVFYSRQDLLNVTWQVSMSFQKIIPFENQNNFFPDGWVHQDFKSVGAGVIYLSEEDGINIGTSIYEQRDFLDDVDYELKKQFYLGNNVDFDLYNKNVEKNNNSFEETVTVKSKFNRLVLYDGSSFHSAKNIMRITKPRYTIVFFIHRLTANSFPALQSRCISL